MLTQMYGRCRLCVLNEMVASTTLVAILLLAVQLHYVETQSITTTKSEFNYTLDDGYPIGRQLFGNIAGVDVDNDNNVIIFHRGSHKWDQSTFDGNDVYLLSKSDPISENTVIAIDPKAKEIIRAWGRNQFFMPHGLSLDQEGKHIWLTDVALHQVFKYTIDGSRKVLAVGTPFVPGNDENHFCKPTSVADTGEFVFVADGYCNSRIVMLSAEGTYLGEFGQSSDAAYLSSQPYLQPTFNIPHKITYAKEAKMLCVADRENGRIQCFSFEPKHRDSSNQDNGARILNGAITPKFMIADPAFNGRLFSLDYSPLRGGILVAVSGESLYSNNKPPLGFVYNATTGFLISRFAPPKGQTFGMAHDLAITGDEAESLFVVDITPVNLWKFSRPVERHQTSRAAELSQMAGQGLNNAMSIMREKEQELGFLWKLLIVSALVSFLVVVYRAKVSSRTTGSESLSALYSNNYSTSINSLFGNNRFPRRSRVNGNRSVFNTTFSGRAFLNLFDRGQQQQNDFSRIPLEESDNSDQDKSDSDVEEFNINQANSSVKINV